MNHEERKTMLIEDKKRREDEAAVVIKSELEAILESTSEQLASGVYFGNEPGQTSGGWILKSPTGGSRLVFSNSCGYWCSEWMDMDFDLFIDGYEPDELSMCMYADYKFDDADQNLGHDDETSEFLEHHPELNEVVLKIAKIVHDYSADHPEEMDR